jgi:hypothetical protein
MLSSQSLEPGGIEPTYLNYTYSGSLKDKGFPVLLDLGKARFSSRPRRRNPARLPQAKPANRRRLDARLCGNRRFYPHTANKEAIIKSLVKNSAFKKYLGRRNRIPGASGPYSLDIRPTIPGTQNLAPCSRLVIKKLNQ